jgi:uncharacterized protein
MKKKSQTAFSIIPSDFISQGIRCSGELYLPTNLKNPPVVIMAHGFAAEKSFRLPAYAEKFVSNGLAVFMFDYRCFGGSEGEPRNYVDPGRHLLDWQAAIAHVRSLSAVNTKKIALWGSSFSGGHVIVTASRDKRISAIVAQVPFVDSISTTRMLGVKYLMQAMPHAIKDTLCMVTFQEPHYVKVIGTPDEFAIMNTPGSYEGFLSIFPEGSTWENRCPARILLTMSTYRPIAFAGKVHCPALIMAAEKDSLIDVRVVKATAKKIPNCEFINYDIGHFEIYTGEDFENAVKKQAEFLLMHLSS